jgi:hypothetical protein
MVTYLSKGLKMYTKQAESHVFDLQFEWFDVENYINHFRTNKINLKNGLIEQKFIEANKV